jgi:Flp pilus assembly protein TadD
MGTPFVPANDDVVLAHLPARQALQGLAALRTAVAARREDLPASLDLARGYIAIGRREGDPRFVGYAEAVLTPWLARTPVPEPALVLKATALQYRHQFGESLALLDRAIALEPLDGQAWLTKAALLELRGDFAQARRACAHLTRAADQILALTCLASVDSRNGQLAASYAALRGVSTETARLPSGIRGWVDSVVADMAERLGRDDEADAELREAISALPDDPYLKAARADLLLRVGRAEEVIALTRDYESNDSLLVRLAIAGQRARSPDAPRWAAAYDDRLQAAARARDSMHTREHALYLLDVRHDVRGALAAAADNWRVQREPTDLRIYVRAAQLAASSRDLEAIDRYLTTTGYEDRALRAGFAHPTSGRP